MTEWERIQEDLETLSSKELLQLYARIEGELRRRGVTRSSNIPTGDLAESLFCKALGLASEPSSNKHFDAIGPDGTRYQIKGRRPNRGGHHPHLSAIRDLEERNFDVLAAVLFSKEYEVVRAVLIPYELVKERSKFVERTNSYRFILQDSVFTLPGVREVTKELQQTDF